MSRRSRCWLAGVEARCVPRWLVLVLVLGVATVAVGTLRRSTGPFDLLN